MKSKFKIVALGGLNENGKNAYVIETENDMILVDAGSANFTNKTLGIDIVIPDYSYVINNKHKLRAIIISHGHLDQMGSLANIIENVDVDVYASYYTVEFLKTYIKKGLHKRLRDIKYNQCLTLNDFNIEVFSLSHAIFGNFGFVISVEKDAIIYATDYNFNQSDNKFSRTDIKRILELSSKYNVLALLTESVSVENKGVAAGNQQFVDSFNRFIETAQGRVIISLYASNLAGMTNVIKYAQMHNKKIVIIGRDLLTYVNIARNLNYITHKKDIFVRINEMKRYDKDLIIVVSGLYAEPFLNLEKMSTQRHNLLQIKNTDSVLIASKAYDEIESQAQEIMDVIARTGCKISSLNINVPSHAYKEDVKMMINLVDPKFVIPIKGEYRKQRMVKQLANEIGMDEKNVVLLENGTIASIYDDYIESEMKIKLSDTLISSNNSNTINPIILKDREILSDSGYVLLIMSFMKGTDVLIQEPEIVSGGLSSFENDEFLIEGCKKIIENEVKKDFTNRELINKLKTKVTRYLQNNIGKTPMILPVRMEIDPKRVKQKKK